MNLLRNNAKVSCNRTFCRWGCPNQLLCCAFLDVIIWRNTRRKENLLEWEAIEQIVVVRSPNNNQMPQHKTTSKIDVYHRKKFFNSLCIFFTSLNSWTLDILDPFVGVGDKSKFFDNDHFSIIFLKFSI